VVGRRKEAAFLGGGSPLRPPLQNSFPGAAHTPPRLPLKMDAIFRGGKGGSLVTVSASYF